MRDAATLRAAAVATGYFDGPKLQYVGDGYTVPWQVATLVDLRVGVTFFAYKAHLDATDLEASRLHDWLYTPYGSLIDVTREEADSALREELAAVSPVDGEIVYRAVRLGGWPYFGHSQTGFKGFFDGPDLPNMAGTGQDKSKHFGGPIMMIKCVMIFQLTTKAVGSQPSVGYGARDHIAGWTEHVISFGPTMADAQNQMFGGGGVVGPVCPARAQLLPTSASIVGVRFYAGSGRGLLVQRQFPGSAGECDHPNICLLVKASDPALPRGRVMRVQAVPDDYVENGEYFPKSPFSDNLAYYLNFGLAGMGYRAQTPANVLDVKTIDATGLVTTVQQPPPAYLTSYVTIRGGKLPDGSKFAGATQKVINVGVNQFQFEFWGTAVKPFGLVQGGKSFQRDTTVGNLSATGSEPVVVRLVTRKVGRPFESYRGRRSKRRKPLS